MTENPYGLGSGMFGTDHEELIAGLKRLGASICHYCYPGREWPVRCDCKYGASLTGEQSGCPEINLAATLIDAMTPTEFRRLAKRSKVLL